MSSRRSGDVSPHHFSVCMINAQYLAQGEGTGVLVDHAGYSCIVAGTHLLPSPVAASKALAHFVLPGMPHHVTVSLRPEALFEVFGKHKLLVITACDRPIFPPSTAIPPAVPAPAEYADTIRRFSSSGRLQSHTEPELPDSSCADELARMPGGLTEARNASRNKHKSSKKYSKRPRKHKTEGVGIDRVRRGAVVPGTPAHRHPNDPDPVQPFAITVDDGGVVVLELVAHQGKSKRAYHTAVLGPGMKQATKWMEAGARGACPSETQVMLGATGERKGEEEAVGGGRGGGWGTTTVALLPNGRQDGLPGPGRGGRCDGKMKKRSKNDGGGLSSQGVHCPESGRRRNNDENGDGQSVAVVVAEGGALDGVHGAPVFLGGQLFGFAIQESVGEHVTGVIPASTLGLLPAPLDAPPSVPTNQRRHSLSNSFNNVIEQHEINHATSSRTPSEGIEEEDTVAAAEKQHVGRGGGGDFSKAVSAKVLLEKMLHLFGHGTPLSLELELNRVGDEALRALRTPDGRSLVHLAAMSGTLVPLEFVHRRLLMDVALAEVPETGNTGLHVAAYCGRIECLRYLLSQGGDAAKKNRHGQTPATLAVLTGRTELLRWLLDRTKNAAGDVRGLFPEELIRMVEDMDEAAVYGSPMYRLLEEAFSIGRPASDGSDSSDNGQEDTDPATSGTKAAAYPLTAAVAANGDEADSIVDFERAWEMFGKGRMDARAVLAVLTRIHGESMDAWWPFVRAALPPGEPLLVRALEEAKRDVERARAEAKTKAREEARARRAATAGRGGDNFSAKEPGCSPRDPGAESMRLQSSTIKYLRDKISAEQFHTEMLRTTKRGGKVEEAVIAKVARGMTEDKAWALMDAHRKWKRAERLDKKSFRESKRAKVVSRRRSSSGEVSPEQGGDDDSSVATIFSLGGTEDALSLPPSSRRGADLDRSVAWYKAGRLSASELKDILSEAFGSQIDCILPGVFATLPTRKRRELAKLCRADKDKPRQPKAFRVTASASSGNVNGEGDGSGNTLGTVHFGPASDAVAATAADGTAATAAARGTRNDDGLAQPQQAPGLEDLQQQQKQHQKRVSVTATRGGRKGAKGQPRTGGFGRPGSVDDDEDMLGPFAPKSNSPFTTRASAWAGRKEDPQEVGHAGEARRAEGRSRNTRSAPPSTQGNDGSDDDDDGDDDKTDAVTGRRKMRDSVADAQRLTSEFAAGRLTAPHFFGAMLEEFGEKRLVKALPEILKILPGDKAADLKAFTSKTEGEAGAATKARLKEKQEAEEKVRKEKEQQDKHRNEMGPTQAGENSMQKTAATKENDKEVHGRKKKAMKQRADAGDDEEGAQNDGKKKQKKTKPGDKSDVKIPAAVIPDQEKEREKKKLGKGKKLKKTEGDEVIGDDDVEGGELYEMTAVERERYDKAFSKLSQDGGAINPAKATSTLQKSGLPRDALRKIWAMADVERDEQLNKEEWAVAMHLTVCVKARKLPLPARLPKCLRHASSNRQQPPKESQQRQHQQGEPAAGEKAAKKGKESMKLQEKTQKEKKKNKPNHPPVDLKRATKEFKSGGLEAEEFLPVLQTAFGKKELAAMWPKLLPTLPPEKAEELAKVAGLNVGETENSSTESSIRQVGLKEATASFKKGDTGAMQYHENVLKKAFGKKLPEMLPSILKALPPDRAAALKAVIEAEADEARRLAEEAPLQWVMSSEDRRVYDNAFVKLDKDKDGFLSITEARPVLKKAVGDKLTESQLGHLWKMADIDGDDRLSREEWAIAYHIVRCVIKREMKLPKMLPEVLGTTAEGRLPAVK